MPQITSRVEFQQRLDRGLKDISTLIQRSPGYDPYAQVEVQLDALKRWTVKGRELTDDERNRVNIGLILVHAFDAQPEQWLYDIMQNLSEIQAYVRKWPPDGDPPYT